MTFTLGFALFFIAIGLSIALHELGHLATAKAFGMKATHYFVGFGPTLWSFRRGETEYGLKAIPAGGFVKIVGMSHVEEVSQEDEPRSFWRYRTWKRCVVMSAGSITHFLLAIVLLYLAAVTWGLPTEKAIVGETASCVVPAAENNGSLRECRPGDPAAPAQQAGLRPGDRIVALDGERVNTYDDFVLAVRERPGESVPLTFVRDGEEQTTTINVFAAQRRPVNDESPDPATGQATVGAVGVTPDPTEAFGPLAAVPATADFSGSIVTGTFRAIAEFPERIPALVRSITGDERDPDTPVSVVGASRFGGQAIEVGEWLIFILLLATFNIFVGIFNLLPLLPLDGGHIAVLMYERVRAAIARALGKAAPGRVDISKLMPITFAFIVLFGGLALLTILADVVNPIDNPFQ